MTGRFRGTLKFCAVCAAILLTSAWLAPVLFKVLPFKFERIFSRLVMIQSLAAAALFVRLRHETPASYGLARTPQAPALFAKAFACGAAILGLLAACRVGFGAAEWAPRLFSEFPLGLAAALGAALLIGVVEELFFRGFVFSHLVRLSKRVAPSLAVTSLVYALAHFLSGEKPFIGDKPGFTDSLRLIAAPLGNLADGSIAPAAFGLFLFGAVLNLWLLRTGSLFPAIGLHAGCVFFLKLDGLFFNYRPDAFWGSARLYDGPGGWIFILMLVPLGRMLFPAAAPENGTAPRRRGGVAVLAFMVATLAAMPARAAEDEETEGKKRSVETLYRFDENLPSAETAVKFPKGAKLRGVWKNDRFAFRKLGAGAEIKLEEDPLGRSEEKVIAFHPVSKAVRRIRFAGVPPASALEVRYLTRPATPGTAPDYFYLKVFAGRKLLHKLRLATSQEQWKTEKISLGVVEFLDADITVTFELISDLKEPALFYLSARAVD